MAKQYNIAKITFNQADFDKVEKYLTEGLKQAFLHESIDIEWCKTYCIPYYMNEVYPKWFEESEKREMERQAKRGGM